MKLSEAKTHYQVFLKNLIERDNEEVFDMSELLKIFKEKGYSKSCHSIRRTLHKIADRMEYNHTTYYGNKKAIAKLRKIFGG